MTTPPLVLCSQAARQSGDDPAGTAAEFSSFLLLEPRPAWSATAADDAVALLPPAAGAAVAAQPGLRAFAIRNVDQRRAPDTTQTDGRSYLGVNGPDGFITSLAGAPLPGDISRLARKSEVPGPMFAVCTNGRRDRCCAIVGRTVAVGLHAEFGERVVEISHLGGHRYAGTMLVMPWGYSYGFLDLAAALTVARAAAQGLVHPDGLRGRADLPPVAQAADVLLRRGIGPASPDAVQVSRVETVSEQGSIALSTVRAMVLGQAVTVTLRRETGPMVSDTLCGGKPFGTGRWSLADQ